MSTSSAGRAATSPAPLVPHAAPQVHLRHSAAPAAEPDLVEMTARMPVSPLAPVPSGVWPRPSAAQTRMYAACVRSSGRTSLYPLYGFALASGGKLLLAVGAGLVVNGVYAAHTGTRNAGAALVVIGFLGALCAALLFAQDVKTINYKLGWILKCCSISAAGLIGAGYGLRGYGVAKQDVTVERCAVLLLVAGLGTMSVTLPWFVTHSEARRGLMPLQPREPIRVGCLASGAGILFGWAVCASGASYPIAASQTVLTVAAMLLTLGIALSTSDILQQAAYAAVTHDGLRAAQSAGAPALLGKVSPAIAAQDAAYPLQP